MFSDNKSLLYGWSSIELEGKIKRKEGNGLGVISFLPQQDER